MAINKTQFYGIKEASSGLFLTHNERYFFPLGERTKLFDKMVDAMAFVEENIVRLNSVYLFDSLEKITGEDRININIDHDTYISLVKDIKFKVAKVHLEEIE